MKNFKHLDISPFGTNHKFPFFFPLSIFIPLEVFIDESWTIFFLEKIFIHDYIMNQGEILFEFLGEGKFYPFLKLYDDKKDNLKLEFDSSCTNKNYINIPEYMFTCINLQEIYLNNNKIFEIPEHINMLSNLKKLDLSGNKLTDITNLLSLMQYFTKNKR